MCKKIVFLSFLLLFCQSVFSQKVGIGHIVDYLTHLAVPDSTTIVELLLPDSTVVDTAETYRIKENAKFTTMFHFDLKNEGDYIIRCTNPDYETVYKPVNVKFYEREEVIN